MPGVVFHADVDGIEVDAALEEGGQRIEQHEQRERVELDWQLQEEEHKQGGAEDDRARAQVGG